MTDGAVPPEAVVDVDGRDPERVPMVWEADADAGPGAGFTTGDPWLPTHPDADRLAVSVEREDPDSSLSLYRVLLDLRRRTPALQHGSYRAVDAAPDVYAYVRQHEDSRLLVVCNFAPFPRPLPPEAAGARLVLSTHASPEPAALAGDEARIYEINDDRRP